MQCLRKQCIMDIKSETGSLRQITVQKQLGPLAALMSAICRGKWENVEFLFHLILIKPFPFPFP